MARNRTASNILELKGAFRKNPNRARKNEPKVDTANVNKRPPAKLTADQKKTWRELIKAIPAGVLSNSDRIQVEIVACLLAEFRDRKGQIPTDRITRLTTEMGKLGLNPSGRASLVVADNPKANKFDD
ncbi:MAG: hypothetical protein AB2745_08590 [Candidatus Thiodiazotropha endolucinida]